MDTDTYCACHWLLIMELVGWSICIYGPATDKPGIYTVQLFHKSFFIISFFTVGNWNWKGIRLIFKNRPRALLRLILCWIESQFNPGIQLDSAPCVYCQFCHHWVVCKFSTISARDEEWQHTFIYFFEALRTLYIMVIIGVVIPRLIINACCVWLLMSCFQIPSAMKSELESLVACF